jgi:hypothetical protein
MRRVLAAISLLLAATAANADRPTVYHLEIVLDPPAGGIEVRGEVGVTLSTVGPRILPLRLHEGFEVRRVSLGGRPLEVTSVPAEATRLQPATQLVNVHLPATVEDPEIRLQVEYGGHLTRLPQFGTPAAEREGKFLDDAIDSERVELAWYSAWYPQLGDFGQTFEADLLVDLPTGWALVGLGEPSPPSQSGNRTQVRWSAEAVQDLVLIASPAFEVVRVEQDDGGVEIYSSRLPRPFVERQAEEIRTALELFEQTLGRAEGASATVRLVYSPRKAGQGGYSRAPLIVASEGVVLDGLAEGEVTSMLGGLAHEAAHFWWHFGVGQGDWINETFAEYFARFAVERILAEERPLARAQRAVSRLPDDAPPLAEVPADNSGDGYTIRYFKGSLMLDALRTALGDEAFFALCREFYLAFRGRQIGTLELRGFWQPRLGKHAALLDLWLDSPGAAPANTGVEVEPQPAEAGREPLIVNFDFVHEGLSYIADPTPERLETLASLSATGHMLTHARLTERDEFDLSSEKAFVASLLDPLIQRRDELLPKIESNLAFLEARPQFWRTCRAEADRYLWPRETTPRLFLTLGYDIGVALPDEASLNIAHRYFLDDVEEALYYCVHELHHAGVLPKHPLPVIGEIRTASELANLVRLSLMVEGTAVYAAWELRRRGGALEDPDYVAIGQPELLRGYEERFFELLTDLAAEPGREVLEADWERFWNDDRIGYRFGFEVARALDEAFGRERFIKLVHQGPETFLRTYRELTSGRER